MSADAAVSSTGRGEASAQRGGNNSEVKVAAKKQKKQKSEVVEGEHERRGKAAAAVYMSPIAHPLLEGKLLRRCLKLIYLAADRERANRSNNSSNSSSSNSTNSSSSVSVNTPNKQQQQNVLQGRQVGGSRPTGTSWKLLRRGVHEVAKSLRRGIKGIVFFASDVFPIEIIAHLPICCEEKDILYAYLCSKRTLGHAFRSQRPASVVMLTPNPAFTSSSNNATTKKKRIAGIDNAPTGADAPNAEPSKDDDGSEDSFEQLYVKVEKALRKIHPYF